MKEVKEIIRMAQALVGSSYDIEVTFKIMGSIMAVCTIEASSFPDEDYHTISGTGLSLDAAFKDFAREHANYVVR